MKNRTVKIGLIGHGTVGQGVVRIFQKSGGLLNDRAGARLELAWICSRRPKPVPVLAGRRPAFTRRWRDVVSDPAVDVVVELIGGIEPARTLVMESLRSGKQVATANKALLAGRWGELFTAARKARALLYLEGSVGGGIPVVQGLNEGLAANRIERIDGIMNGTTNYILTRMSEEGLPFCRALAAAQKAGFAEADPSFDIDGLDAAQKLAILASLASGGWVRTEDVHREGIAGVDVWDVAFARRRLGLATKLLASVELDGPRFLARVRPALIPESHPFAHVRNEYNAFFVHGDAVGDVMFYGKGAGQMATASAVVSDVIFLARHVANGTAGRAPYVTFLPGRRLRPLPPGRQRSRHYLRFDSVDRPGVLARITGLLARQGVSIASVYQGDAPVARADVVKRRVPVVIVTHEAPEDAVRRAVGSVERLSVVLAPAVCRRIEPL